MWHAEQLRPGIWAGFTDSTAGNLAFHVGDDTEQVSERRAVVNAELGARTGHTVHLRYMNQVHGHAVAQLHNGNATVFANAEDLYGVSPDEEILSVDALMAFGAQSTTAGLAVMVADCVPVVLMGEAGADDSSPTITGMGEPVIAVAHAGRPGVERGVLAATVQRMRAAGARNIEAWLGPSVCGRCYEVPAAMRADVAQKQPESWAVTSWGTPALDLPAAALAQLSALDVKAHASGVCTMEDARYYSHRRSQRDGLDEGRFIGFVVAGHPGPANASAPN